MYALKKEVAVMASPPHFISPCLFPKVCFLGSKHDYQFFKENYSVYLDYLRKEVAERKQLLNDEPAFWGVCQDKGYTGPAEDTPEIRRVIPRKNGRHEERKANQEISNIRVHVERFFGRFTQLWKVAQVLFFVHIHETKSWKC